MKKVTLFMSLILLGTLGFGQVIFQVQTPSSLAGNYALTFVDADGTWGVKDLNIPANSVTAPLMFVDSTFVDSLACNPPIAENLSGKIAVLYRGSCEFGAKAVAAQDAGAIGVIIINNIPGPPVGMAAGAVGINDTIPTIMISDVDGATLRDEIRAGNVTGFIGSKVGLFADDLGSGIGDVVRSRRFSNITLLSQNASEFSIPPGMWVRNIGNQDQSNASASVNIDFGGSSIYSDTVPVNGLVSGDSIFVSFASFSQTSYPAGLYEMSYTITTQNPDGDPNDNVVETNFMIDDNIYSYSRLDPTTKELLSPAGFRPGGTFSDYENCLAFEDPNASRVAATGMTFSATTNDADVLTNEFIEARIYQWDDVFTDINDPAFAFANLTLVDNSFFVYSSDAQDSNIAVDFTNPLILADDQKYLFCFATTSQTLFLGFDNQLDYRTTQDTAFAQASFPSTTDAQSSIFLNGFGTELVPALSVNMVDATTVGIDEKGLGETIVPFPNPVKNIISIPVGQLSGAAQLEIVDMTGRLVSTQDVSFGTNDVLTVDVSSISNGTYIFNLRLNDGNTNKFNVIINK